VSNITTLQHDDFQVDIVVEEVASVSGATNASVGSDVVDGATVIAKRSIGEAVAMMGRLASAFTTTLAETNPRPSEVQLEFGIEAAGEAGNFVISKLSGKANFSVKMLWRFERGQ
jgi:hypothetical protein